MSTTGKRFSDANFRIQISYSKLHSGGEMIYPRIETVATRFLIKILSQKP